MIAQIREGGEGDPDAMISTREEEQAHGRCRKQATAAVIGLITNLRGAGADKKVGKDEAHETQSRVALSKRGKGERAPSWVARSPVRVWNLGAGAAWQRQFAIGCQLSLPRHRKEAR